MAAFDEIWSSMKLGSRVSAIALAALILFAAVAAAVWVLSDRYETLFSAMEPQDAAAVISELERAGVAYELAEEGTRISVPAEQVHEMRVKLMGSGVPLRGGVGFEIFDDSDFGMTEFAQKINYQRALEGELSRTISSLKEVKYARVHLVMPESSLFNKQQSPPSASITLFLKQDATLDESRILGLQRLVSAAVAGLDMNGVTVTDQNGVTLTRKVEQDDESQAATSRLQRKQEVEAYLKNKVTDVLERALGAGRGVVSVDVSLNMNQVRTTREEVLPQGDAQRGVLRRRESRSESGRASPQNGNVVTETEYRLGRQVEQIVLTPGAIERLSIGVLVPEEIASHRLEEIRTLVSMAVGLNTARGDAIAVVGAPMASDVGLEAELQLGDQTLATPALPEVREERLPSAELSRTFELNPRMWLQHRQVAIGVVVIVLALLALLIAVFRSRPRRLRPEERALMLERIEGWLQAEPASFVEKGQS